MELGWRPLVARLREVDSAVKRSFSIFAQNNSRPRLHLEVCSVVSRHQLQPGCVRWPTTYNLCSLVIARRKGVLVSGNLRFGG